MLITCLYCKKQKPSSKFYKARKRKTGYEAFCKECGNLVHNRWKRANPGRWQEIQDRRRAKRKLIVMTHYGNGKAACVCCGEAEISFLTLDHVNGGGQEHRRKLSSASFYGALIRRGLPNRPKLETACMNCNWGKRILGICPHKRK